MIGDGDAVIFLEARAGTRYQRTAVNGEVSVAGFTVRPGDSVDDGSDALVGARAMVRPARWLAF